jgi:hypothetical protein
MPLGFLVRKYQTKASVGKLGFNFTFTLVCVFSVVFLVEVDAGINFRKCEGEHEGDRDADQGDVVEAAVVDDLVDRQKLRGQAARESAEKNCGSSVT